MGIGIATIVRVFLFLAVLGVVVETATSAAHTLDPDNPAADAFLIGAGEIGYRFFGLVLLCAALTSIVGCAYTSVSFLKTFHKSIEKHENAVIVGFIALSTVVMKHPTLLLILGIIVVIASAYLGITTFGSNLGKLL